MEKIKYLFLLIILITELTMAQTVRPIRDDIGFCWKANEMDHLMSYLIKHNKITIAGSNKLIAAISPHDDYLYAGNIYYKLYPHIKTKEVVVFGVTHGTVRKAMNDPEDVLIFDDYDEWIGPYGNVKVSPLRDIIKNKLDKDYQVVSDKAQEIEHSIEAIIPFLQYYNRDVKITPIMVTGMHYNRMEQISKQLSDIITEYIKEKHLQLGTDIFILISTDANHYGKYFDNTPYGEDEAAHKKATSRDKEIGNTVFKGVINYVKVREAAESFWPELKAKDIYPIWCGRYPITFGLMATINIVKKISGKDIIGKFLGYSDSWTEGVIPIKQTNMGLTAPFSLKHWVGYAAAGFYLK